MSAQTPEEVASSLPPLTDEQVRRVAALLSTVPVPAPSGVPEP